MKGEEGAHASRRGSSQSCPVATASQSCCENGGGGDQTNQHMMPADSITATVASRSVLHVSLIICT